MSDRPGPSTCRRTRGGAAGQRVPSTPCRRATASEQDRARRERAGEARTRSHGRPRRWSAQRRLPHPRLILRHMWTSGSTRQRRERGAARAWLAREAPQRGCPSAGKASGAELAASGDARTRRRNSGSGAGGAAGCGNVREPAARPDTTNGGRQSTFGKAQVRLAWTLHGRAGVRQLRHGRRRLQQRLFAAALEGPRRLPSGAGAVARRVSGGQNFQQKVSSGFRHRRHRCVVIFRVRTAKAVNSHITQPAAPEAQRALRQTLAAHEINK